jgi:L-ascorbate metabolism protein UlaG (beta-lactamase superfamily)
MDQPKTLALPTHGDRPNLAEGSIFFVGTATVILRYAGFTILTDPNFLHQGDHVHLGYGLRSQRQTNPAIELEALPPIDLVVLSHLHEDHFDRLVEQKLDKQIPIITTPHAAEGLRKKGFQAPYTIGTWEAFTITKGDVNLKITAMPGRHGPGVLAAALPPVMGSLLEFQTNQVSPLFQVYITGDTLVYDQIKEIPQRYPEIDLALLHLGGTQVLGVLLTMDAHQGVEMVQLIAPQTAIPIHFNDYTVFKSPLEDFQKAIAAADLKTQMIYLQHGDTYQFEIPAQRWSSS